MKAVDFENMAAQGDILIIKINEIPSEATEKKAENGVHIVTHSETGHHHTVDAANARFFDGGQMICYLQVAEAAELVHHRSFDTHAPINLTPGNYKIVRQREYTPEGWRRIED